ncbi:MAG: hypothetical protein QOJ20_3987 [Mycobacterium sp.]|jgi:hypothetical protein|nr:hypothetical protein [Mycobacterium sp.]
MRNRTRLIGSAFVAAAVAVPLYAAAVSTDSAQVTAAPACLAWFGNKEDGKCLSYSNGQPINVGTPWCNGGNGPDAGCSSGPLLPGTSINQGIG